MRNDKLWQNEDVQKALLILGYYQTEESKVLFTSSGEKYDSVPNRQAVTDMNADAKTLRIGSAWEYCHEVNKAVFVMKKKHYNTYADIIKDWYLRGKRLTVDNEMKRLPYNSYRSFYENLPKAIQRFSIECPDNVFEALYNAVVKRKDNKSKITVK